MKKFIASGLIFLILISFLIFRIVNGDTQIDPISPISKEEKILGVNQWFPKDSLEIESEPPKITAKGALFINIKDGTTLYSKNPNEKLPIASLAKVMTVLIALEHKNMEDIYLVSRRATEAEPDEMILLSGETLTLKELLYGIFLVSANDAAEVLSEESLPAGRQEFIRLMNEKAKLLGLNNTNFVNPTGLDEDNNNSYLPPEAEVKVPREQYARAGSYSTAFDLAVLTRYLIRRFPEVLNISKTEYIYIPKTQTHQDYEMYSGINLLTTYPGVIGFKTGYTPQAGFTLITVARIDGQEILGVLLDSQYRRDEAKMLLDYSFKKLSVL